MTLVKLSRKIKNAISQSISSLDGSVTFVISSASVTFLCKNSTQSQLSEKDYYQFFMYFFLNTFMASSL